MTYVGLGVAGCSLIVSVIALAVTIRRPRTDQRFDGVRQAADALTAALQDLKAVMWDAAATMPDPLVVRDVTYAADRACRVYESRLPRGLAGLRLSVRQASANYFGGAATYSVDPRTASLPLDEHEYHWWDIGVGYLDYAIDVIQQWRENPGRRGLRLQPYDWWRRDEDAEYHANRLLRASETPESS